MTQTIDVQGHVFTDAYHAELVALAEMQPHLGLMLQSLAALDRESQMRRVDDARVATMDAAGVDVQVLSLQPPPAWFHEAPRAADLAATFNDEVIAAAGRYPGRFLVLCTLPYPHVEECLAELDRLTPNPLVRGAIVHTHASPFTVDEPQFEAVFAKLAELRMPAVLHPTAFAPPLLQPYNLTTVLGMMLTSSAGALALILGGTLDRVPALDVVVTHLGGTIPFLTGRALDLGMGSSEHDLLHYLRNRVWLDSNSYWPPALRCSIETVGGDRIMLGSDYPLRRTLADAVVDIRSANLDDPTTNAILGGTAERWFAVHPLRATEQA